MNGPAERDRLDRFVSWKLTAPDPFLSRCQHQLLSSFGFGGKNRNEVDERVQESVLNRAWICSRAAVFAGIMFLIPDIGLTFPCPFKT